MWLYFLTDCDLDDDGILEIGMRAYCKVGIWILWYGYDKKKKPDFRKFIYRSTNFSDFPIRPMMYDDWILQLDSTIGQM